MHTHIDKQTITFDFMSLTSIISTTKQVFVSNVGFLCLGTIAVPQIWQSIPDIVSLMGATGVIIGLFLTDRIKRRKQKHDLRIETVMTEQKIKDMETQRQKEETQRETQELENEAMKLQLEKTRIELEKMQED